MHFLKRIALILIFLCGNGIAFSQVAVDLLPASLKAAKPGDTIIVTDQFVRDRILKLEGKGTAEAPIVIRPQTPGGVVFSGESAIQLKGEHIMLSGFLFQDGYSPVKQVVSIEGIGCRLSSTVFDSYNPPDPEKKEDKWVTLRGKNHRVDGCSFLNKISKSVTLVVWRDNPEEDGHIISGNLFSGRPKGKESNGYETIRIGDSKQSLSDSKTVIEGNLFENCDGEMEIISVKSGKNLIRGNTFLQCAGTITLRHGNGSIIEGNIIAGKLKRETGGIRVYGKDHIIRGNAIIGTTGRSEGAITFMAGTPNPDLSGYHRVESVLVEKNLFAANEGPIFKFDAEFGEDGRIEAPKKLIVRENFLSGKPDSKLMRGEDKLAAGDLKWERDNKVYLNNSFPKEVTRSIPQPLSKAAVGATWYRGTR